MDEDSVTVRQQASDVATSFLWRISRRVWSGPLVGFAVVDDDVVETLATEVDTSLAAENIHAVCLRSIG